MVCISSGYGIDSSNINSRITRITITEQYEYTKCWLLISNTVFTESYQWQEELEKLSKKLEEEKAAMTNIANQFKEEKEMTAQ